MSSAIRELVVRSESLGLVADQSEWSEAFVYWFDALMPSDVRTLGSANPTLDYFNSDGTPHNPAGEGFIDRNTKTAISFLLQVKEA